MAQISNGKLVNPGGVRFTPSVKNVEEAAFGALLQDPKVRRRFNKILKELQEEAREEIESLERSTRLTDDDYRTIINARG